MRTPNYSTDAVVAEVAAAAADDGDAVRAALFVMTVIGAETNEADDVAVVTTGVIIDADVVAAAANGPEDVAAVDIDDCGVCWSEFVKLINSV